jgi:hypothetical protein
VVDVCLKLPDGRRVAVLVSLIVFIFPHSTGQGCACGCCSEAFEVQRAACRGLGGRRGMPASQCGQTAHAAACSK